MVHYGASFIENVPKYIWEDSSWARQAETNKLWGWHLGRGSNLERLIWRACQTNEQGAKTWRESPSLPLGEWEKGWGNKSSKHWSIAVRGSWGLNSPGSPLYPLWCFVGVVIIASKNSKSCNDALIEASKSLFAKAVCCRNYLLTWQSCTTIWVNSGWSLTSSKYPRTQWVLPPGLYSNYHSSRQK